jgi:hypothetical protein
MKIYKQYKQYEICDLAGWLKYFPPKNKKIQWKDGRSAKEMAKFWLNDANREEFKRFIREIKGFEKFEFDYIIPEYESKFDCFRNPRYHDLLIVGKDNNTIITIEGKADEPFGKQFKKVKIPNANSNVLGRIKNLYENYFKNNKAVLDIMYQLTHWFAGSLAEAKRRDMENIIMVLQVFKSNSTSNNKIQKNHAEFEKFIEFISDGRYTTIANKEIIGPIESQYTEDKKLYIGYFLLDIDSGENN